MTTTLTIKRERAKGDDHYYFAQERHGQREHGQSPGFIFLEDCHARFRDWAADIGPRPFLVEVRVTKGGKHLPRRDRPRTPAELNSALLKYLDGHLTAIERDDYSTRLIVIDAADDEENEPIYDLKRGYWIEMLNADTDPRFHPEMGEVFG